ncbi:nitroreductase family deazaflavin-dependent oxidoreductase [Occultella glacieicola]|uniref:Nitroreductase family deazaflavin-dependent oxidoreductase n=1 Tax=Occultella glacieicola TaxID=2518684 RepID=A0ABY2DZA2_9MICO|nr:nitroreductase family deazaflavin-dependent oxidoreductase [Occultella glacieicola]
MVHRAGALKRALYRTGRPTAPMRCWNRLDARLYALCGLVPRRAAVLEVPGRHSGQVHRVPVAIADLDGDEYLVSMLGPGANWVGNVEATGARATLRRRGRSVRVRLEPVPVAERAPILRRYLAVARGARPHLAVSPEAPLTEFARIAANHPTFRVQDR